MKNHAALVLFALLLPATLALPTVDVSATTYKVGVKVGHWAKYSPVLGGWTNTSIPPPDFVTEARNTEWILITVQGVEDADVTLLGITQFKNDTQNVRINLGNIQTGTGNLSHQVVAAELTVGDKVSEHGKAPTISKTESKLYAGAWREVNYGNWTEVTDQGEGVGYEFRWDKVSGIMTAMQFTREYLSSDYSGLAILTMTLKETNIWQATDSSNTNPTPPFDTQLLIAGGGIIIAGVLAAYAVFRKPKRTRRRPQKGKTAIIRGQEFFSCAGVLARVSSSVRCRWS